MAHVASGKKSLMLVSPWILAVLVLIVMTLVDDVETLRVLYIVAAGASVLGVFLFGVSRWSKYGPLAQDGGSDDAASNRAADAASPGGPAPDPSGR